MSCVENTELMGAALRAQAESFLVELGEVAASVGRKLEDIQVLPVSKGQGANRIQAALESFGSFYGHLGESYATELRQKAANLSAFGVQWHYLGALQRRSLKKILGTVAYLHSVSRVEELELLANHLDISPKFFLQVNVSSEPQKNGVELEQVAAFIERVAELGLETKLCGLMGMASSLDLASEQDVRKSFALLYGIREKLLPSGKLSMGMSSDWHWAVAEGADLVRIGTRLWGPKSALSG